MPEKFTKIIKAIGYVFATVLLGAIGSGFWEKALSPFLSYASRKITEVLSSVSNSYSNYLYHQAANIYDTGSPVDVLMIGFILITLILLAISLKANPQGTIPHSIYQSLIISMRHHTIIFYLGASLIALTIFYSRIFTIEQIQVYLKTQIAILRPYINENEHARLYSNFLRMESKSDFDNLISRINLDAKAAGITIKQYE
jgi:hypothetical protein